jgi:four helix bundle protein
MANDNVKKVRQLRVWHSVRALKLSIYALIDSGAFDRAERLREQLREAAASAASHVSEGYGRFEPLDHARFLRIGKASLLECQNHLVDAVDRRLMTDAARQPYDDRIEEVLKEIGSLITYLQSPEAKRNVERIKRDQAARRARRKDRGAKGEPGTKREPGS